MKLTCQDPSSLCHPFDTLLLQSRQSAWRLWVKRALDCGVALCGIVLLSPVFLGVGILIWLTLGRPILFRQQRPGQFAKPFWLLKYRTMLNECDSDGRLLPDGDRLTRVGRLLRATSLDELPQLWNVLCGDVSLVGPRPLLMRYLSRYSPWQARRHTVMPGITGWAQVNGRNALNWEQKLDLDVWYADNWSLWLDLKIMFLTVLKVIRRDGINHPDHATMAEFMGTADHRKY